MHTIDAIRSRRSIRSYLSRGVDRDLLEQLIWDAAQAPPPRRGQVPWTFNVIEGLDRISVYGQRAKRYAKENHPDEPGWEWAETPDFEVFWGAPVLIVVSGRVEDCCRAGENLLLSAHARGLGTCWVGSPLLWLRNPSIKAELGIPPDLVPGAAICLGYPASIPEATRRDWPTIIWSK
ncbi:MAG: nitroreductase family protein [Alphaproteobacteria bacterium]|nr:nitroreductase family protein [Alphaproteobacteria bacterium]